MNAVRKFFTPSTGSRARNIARAVLPAVVLLGWLELDGTQLAGCVIAIEAIFSGGAEITNRNNNEGA